MKKVLFLLCACFLSTSVLAVPLRSGFYVNAKAGGTRTDMKTPTARDDSVPFTMALALGGRIRHFRIEAEYSFGTKAKMKGYQQEMETITCQLYFDIP